MLVEVLVEVLVGYLLGVIDTGDAAVMSQLYTKTAGSTLNTGCILETVSLQPSAYGLEKYCGLRCLYTPQCRLYCVLHGTQKCTLSDAFVAVRFEGHSRGTKFDACFTSWGHGLDVLTPSTPVTSSSIYNPVNNPPRFATDGYVCDEGEYYATQREEYSWIQFDLLEPKIVSAVVVVIGYPNEFVDIDVYLGNSSWYADNPVWGRYPGSLPVKVSGTILPKGTPFAGRYITFLSVARNYIDVCEVQVIEGF